MSSVLKENTAFSILTPPFKITNLTSDDISLEASLNSTSFFEFPELSITFEIVTAEQYAIINQCLSASIIAIAVIGVFLNAINIKTFIRMGLQDGVTITFLTLSLTDFCFDLVTTIQSGSRLLVSTERDIGLWFPIDPFAVDVFANIVAMSLHTVSSLTTAFLSIVRCMCIAKPLKFKNMFTRKRSLLAFVLFVIGAMALYTPLLSNMGMQTKYDPHQNASRRVIWLSNDRERVKNIIFSFNYLYFSMLTQISMVVSVAIMVSHLKRSVRFRQKECANSNENEPTKLSGKERSVVLQIITITLICISCNLLKIIHGLFAILDPKYYINQPRHYLYFTIASARVAFDCINATFNFFVYLFFNSRFRSLCFTCTTQ